MREDQQERRRGNLTMCDIHFVQPAKVGLSPFRARGQKEGECHQDNVDRTDDLTRILTLKIGTAIMYRREYEPDDDG